MVLLHTFIAGVAGTILMSIVMTLIHRIGWTNADMVRALGALVTKSYENSLLPGLAIHYAAGALIAIPYTLILNSLGELSPVALAVVGGALFVIRRRRGRAERRQRE